MSELEGFYYDLPFEEYQNIPALNGSSIVHMRRSPMKYKHELDNPTPATPTMILGTITHRMVLEPNIVGEIAIWGLEPEQKVRRGGVWDAFQAANSERTILTADEYESTSNMASGALRNSPISKYSTAVGPTEVSMFWRHPHTGRRYKARIDKLIPDTHTIFDLKTTRDCHSYKFGGQAYQLGYHIKMGLYAEGYEFLTGKEPKVVLGAIDSKAPYESAVYRVTRDVLLQGREELMNLVSRLDDCEKDNKWPAENEAESDLLLPAWAMDSNEGEE